MGFMAGKKALIVGVASERSIAAGIAAAFAREGCEIAFTYQNEKLKSRVEKLSDRLGQDTDLLYSFARALALLTSSGVKASSPTAESRRMKDSAMGPPISARSPRGHRKIWNSVG